MISDPWKAIGTHEQTDSVLIMELRPVRSSAIQAIGYDDAQGVLRVVFREGYVYEFFLVPRSLFDAFMASESKGKFFDEKLRHGPYGWRRS